ncbi:MAG: YfhO family protein [Clostridia bacterium]|nr:YfhO family protein [Clostridia bacterium]
MAKEQLTVSDPAKKTRPWYLAGAFFLPLVLMYLIYIGMEVWPFGKNSVLVLDLNGQYVYYFEEFRRIIHGEANLLYSWTRSLGGEFLGIFAYYLCSPFSLIAALLPAAWMTESLLVMILCKVGMCGATMSYYLTKSRGVRSYTAILFGTMYALCAYGVIQAMNTMWIDAMYLFPLVLLGVERIMHGGKPILYCLCLFILFLTNYYIGYMTCIFLVMYFFYAYFTEAKFSVKTFVGYGLRFALYSVLAAAMAAALLIPAYYGLTFGKTEFQNTDYSFLQRFDFLDLLTKFLPASYDTVRPEGLPVVYSGMLTLIFAPLYFASREISNKKKVWSGVILVFLCMSMNASTVDIFWHGLSKPNWLNYRYSFMLCFFIIAMAADAFSRFAHDRADLPEDGEDAGVSLLSMKSVLTVSLALFLAILVIQKEDYDYLDDINCIWMSLAFLGGYCAALHPLPGKKWKIAGQAAVLVIVCVELFASGLSDLVALDADVVYSDRQPYANFMARFRPIVSEVLSKDESLYRMEKTVHRKVNDNMALGIRGISHSSSDLNASVIKLLGQFGYSSRSHWSKYLGGTPVSDALLGIKYVIAEDEVSPLYNEVASTADLYAYENPYALSIGYMANDAVFDYDMEDTTTPFKRLNDLVTRMLGETKTVELFKSIDVDKTDYNNCDYGFTTGHRKYSPENENKSASLTYSLKAPNANEIFVYFPSDWAREVELSLNGEDWGTYFGNETRRIVSLGSFLPNEPFTLQMTLKEDVVYIGTGVNYFWYLDEDLYKEIMPRLQDYDLQVTDWNDTRIEGTIVKNEEHTRFFTTIPYDEGWKVTVDGKEYPIERTLGALISVDLSGLEDGLHTVKMHYMPDCYVWGFLISVSGIVLFLLCTLIAHLIGRSSHRRAELETESVSDDRTVIPLSELLSEMEKDTAKLPPESTDDDALLDSLLPPTADETETEDAPAMSPASDAPALDEDPVIARVSALVDHAPENDSVPEADDAADADSADHDDVMGFLDTLFEASPSEDSGDADTDKKTE